MFSISFVVFLIWNCDCILHFFFAKFYQLQLNLHVQQKLIELFILLEFNCNENEKKSSM